MKLRTQVKFKQVNRESLGKPRVGVSACLLGQAVRYDGKHQRNSFIADELMRYFSLFALCPENQAGLGVPRPPVRLVDFSGNIKAIGVYDASLDVTASLQAISGEIGDTFESERVDGLVLKSRSPSCGVDDAPFFNRSGDEIALVSGIFSTSMRKRFPHLPLISETLLADKTHCEAFVNAVYRYRGRHD